MASIAELPSPPLNGLNLSGVPKRRVLLAALIGPMIFAAGGFLAVERGLMAIVPTAAVVVGLTLLLCLGLLCYLTAALSCSEQALREGALQFQTIVNSIPQIAWITEADGRYMWFNEQWYEYSGTTFEDSQERRWEIFHKPEQIPAFYAKWKAALATSTPWEDIYQLRSRTGEYRWFLSRALPLFDEEGKVVRWFGTNTDIDQQVKTEEALRESQLMAERAAQAKAQFLANMSHEIRTPITAIMGFTELMKNPELTPAKRTYYTQIVERNSGQLLRLIDDILDLSKVDAGKVSLEKNHVWLADCLTTVSSIMALKAADKGILYTLNVEGWVPDQICTDQLRLKQILTNLIGNAVKFTDHGGVTVTVSFAAPILRFAISDTGPGISQDQAVRLFQPFSQADSSTTRRFGGTGLGLMLSRNLSRALGGNVVLQESTVGYGSTFVATVEVGSIPGAGCLPGLQGSSTALASAGMASKGETLAPSPGH